jgi:hypothetical protein
LLTNFSYGKNVSSATFRDPLGEETKKLKTKLLYFACIAIVVGSFDFEFKGISGFIEFESKPPTFLIGGLLGFGVLYYLFLFIFYLVDDYLKWNNEVVIQSTKPHWDKLDRIVTTTTQIEALAKKLDNRADELAEKIFFSSDFIESEDEYLKNTLGEASYTTLKNCLFGKKGVSLKEFRRETQPFRQKLGEEAAQYLLHKIRVNVPDDVNIYSVTHYLDHVVTEDLKSVTAKYCEVARDSATLYSDTIKKFQNHNLGISLVQWITLIGIEVATPLVLAFIGGSLVKVDFVETLRGIGESISRVFA